MSKPFVFKARLKVADLFHHTNHLEVFTTALSKKETVEHFLLRVLGFCALSYNELTYLNQKNDKQLPDVWCEDEQGEVSIALYVSKFELNELSKLLKQFEKVILFITDDDDEWYTGIEPNLGLFDNISIFSIQSRFLEQLEENLTNSLHWDILIEQNSFSVTDKSGFYQTDVTQLH